MSIRCWTTINWLYGRGSPTCHAIWEEELILHERVDNEKVSLAVFDIDGTVIDGQSPVLMVFNLMRQRKFPIRTAVRAGLWGLKYKAGIATDSVNVRQGIFRVFEDMPAEETDRLITRVYRDNIAPRARQQAIERIAWHQVHGDLVILTSASFEIIAKLFTEDLRAYGQVSTRMAVENGSYTGEIDGIPVEGPEKVRRLEAFADEHFGEGNWKVSYSYGDHESDVDILSLAEHPVAVNPKRRLEAIALERGWEIQEWK